MHKNLQEGHDTQEDALFRNAVFLARVFKYDTDITLVRAPWLYGVVDIPLLSSSIHLLITPRLWFRGAVCITTVQMPTRGIDNSSGDVCFSDSFAFSLPPLLFPYT